MFQLVSVLLKLLDMMTNTVTIRIIWVKLKKGWVKNMTEEELRRKETETILICQGQNFTQRNIILVVLGAEGNAKFFCIFLSYK